MIHPALPDGGGYTLQPFTKPAPPIVTDRHGTALTARDNPGLAQILTQLQARTPTTSTKPWEYGCPPSGTAAAGAPSPP